jgi:hypothetical protein
MGGWRNWSQNLLNGPPLPAPPAFAALAIAGLVAVRLIPLPGPLESKMVMRFRCAGGSGGRTVNVIR